MNLLMQVLSLVGAGFILGAFYALQRRRWTSHAAGYLWLNLLGALLLTIVALADGRAGFIVLEAAWAGLSLNSLVRGPGVGAPPPPA